LGPGTYAVDISATGFTPRTVPGVGILEGNLVTREFWLAPDVQVPDPEFLPDEGTYTTRIDVVLTCPNPSPDVEIRYTTDGSEPDDGSTLYSLPIPISQSTSIKSKAYLFGFTPSYTVTGHYTIDLVDGDLSGEGDVDLTDIVMALQVMAGIAPASDVLLSGDVDGDDKVGIQEVIYILQSMSGLR